MTNEEPKQGQIVYVKSPKSGDLWVVGTFNKKYNKLFYINEYPFGFYELTTKNPFEK